MTTLAMGSLAFTWLGGSEVGVWSTDREAAPADTDRAVRLLIGASSTSSGSSALETVAFNPESAEGYGQPSVDVVRVPTITIAEALIHREPGPWSPSISWLHRALLVAAEIAEAGHVSPQVKTAGLRWSAGWTILSSPAVDGLITEQASLAPPVVHGALTSNPITQTRELVEALVDDVCRISLIEADWRSTLPRSRTNSVVALRRVSTALSGRDPIFVGDTAAHERVFTELSTGLSEYLSLLEGAPEVSFRARLDLPEDDSGDWLLELEVVRADGVTVGFDSVWRLDDVAARFADGASMSPLHARMRDLVDRLETHIGLFRRLRDDPEPSRLILDAVEVSELLDDSLGACRRAGLPILVPSGLVRGQARLTARATTPERFESGNGSSLISVDWDLALGDVTLTRAELQTLADSKADLVALRGNWLQVDRDALNDMIDQLDHRRLNSAELSPAELLRESFVAIDGDINKDLTAQGWVSDLLAGLPDDQLTEAVEPSSFVGTLRPYQRRALAWLQFLGRIGLGGVLADDMGLGKTPTALAHLRARRVEDGMREPHLVVCPLSVVANWEAEAGRFIPDSKVLVAHGPDRPRGAEFARSAAEHDVVITTYGTASRAIDDLALVSWDVVTCDEAQMIKNHSTNAAQAVRAVSANQKIALTGTPVENRLTELWAILDALNPGMLGGITWFRRTFAKPIENDDDAERLESLRRITRPFVLRRTKADRTLVPDLPDKIEQVAWATLTEEQAGLYQAIVDDFLETVAATTGMERRGLVLATLTKLKQVCNHPAHFLREQSVGTGRSGKLERFDELVEQILDNEERVLVFTQYREMGRLLVGHLGSRWNIDVPFLHGGTTKKARDGMVEMFQADEGPPVQLISLRAGGTGLNLTAASRVVHYDRWWNPAVEDQATDRSWRIGQDRTVFVHKLVCQGTLEERIDALLTDKRLLADSVLGGGEGMLTELSTDELRELVRFDDSSLRHEPV